MGPNYKIQNHRQVRFVTKMSHTIQGTNTFAAEADVLGMKSFSST